MKAALFPWWIAVVLCGNHPASTDFLLRQRLFEQCPPARGKNAPDPDTKATSTPLRPLNIQPPHPIIPHNRKSNCLSVTLQNKKFAAQAAWLELASKLNGYLLAAAAERPPVYAFPSVRTIAFEEKPSRYRNVGDIFSACAAEINGRKSEYGLTHDRQK